MRDAHEIAKDAGGPLSYDDFLALVKAEWGDKFDLARFDRQTVRAQRAGLAFLKAGKYHIRQPKRYVVMSRLSTEAIAELMPCAKVLPGGYVQFGTHPMPLDEAIKEMQARQTKPLLILDDPDNVQEIGMMYSEVWIEDEAGNRVTG